MKEIGPPAADVGVLVGRFQVHKLHQAHLDLIRYVIERHDRVLIFLGTSSSRVVTYHSSAVAISMLFPNRP